MSEILLGSIFNFAFLYLNFYYFQIYFLQRIDIKPYSGVTSSRFQFEK